MINQSSNEESSFSFDSSSASDVSGFTFIEHDSLSNEVEQGWSDDCWHTIDCLGRKDVSSSASLDNHTVSSQSYTRSLSLEPATPSSTCLPSDLVTSVGDVEVVVETDTNEETIEDLENAPLEFSTQEQLSDKQRHEHLSLSDLLDDYSTISRSDIVGSGSEVLSCHVSQGQHKMATHSLLQGIGTAFVIQDEHEHEHGRQYHYLTYGNGFSRHPQQLADSYQSNESLDLLVGQELSSCLDIKAPGTDFCYDRDIEDSNWMMYWQEPAVE